MQGEDKTSESRYLRGRLKVNKSGSLHHSDPTLIEPTGALPQDERSLNLCLVHRFWLISGLYPSTHSRPDNPSHSFAPYSIFISCTRTFSLLISYYWQHESHLLVLFPHTHRLCTKGTSRILLSLCVLFLGFSGRKNLRMSIHQPRHQRSSVAS